MVSGIRGGGTGATAAPCEDDDICILFSCSDFCCLSGGCRDLGCGDDDDERECTAAATAAAAADDDDDVIVVVGGGEEEEVEGEGRM